MKAFVRLVEIDALSMPLVHQLIVLRIVRVILEAAACLTFPKQKVKTFIPILCFSSGIILALITLMIGRPILLKFRHLSRTLWMNNVITKRRHNVIRAYRIGLTNTVFLSYILVIIGNIAWHFTGGQKHIISLVYIEEHYSHLYYYVLFIEMCLFHASLHVGFSFTNTIVDVILTVIEQVCLYADSIEANEILHNPVHRNVSLTKCTTDEVYQKRVHGELRHLYYEHLKLVRLGTMFYHSPVPKLGGSIIQLVGMSMIPIVISCSVHFSRVKTIAFMTPLLVMVFLYIATSFNLGQIYTDQVSRVYESFDNMNWYLWSPSNKKSYMLLITRITFVDSVCIGFNTPVNRGSLIKYVKILYSLLTFLYQTNMF